MRHRTEKMCLSLVLLLAVGCSGEADFCPRDGGGGLGIHWRAQRSAGSLTLDVAVTLGSEAQTVHETGVASFILRTSKQPWRKLAVELDRRVTDPGFANVTIGTLQVQLDPTHPAAAMFNGIDKSAVTRFRTLAPNSTGIFSDVDQSGNPATKVYSTVVADGGIVDVNLDIAKVEAYLAPLNQELATRGLKPLTTVNGRGFVSFQEREVMDGAGRSLGRDTFMGLLLLVAQEGSLVTSLSVANWRSNHAVNQFFASTSLTDLLDDAKVRFCPVQ